MSRPVFHMSPYYLNHSKYENLTRGLLILFLPLQDEMTDIHQKDVKLLLSEFRSKIQEKSQIFEKYKNLTDLILSIESTEDKNDDLLMNQRRNQLRLKQLRNFRLTILIDGQKI